MRTIAVGLTTLLVAVACVGAAPTPGPATARPGATGAAPGASATPVTGAATAGPTARPGGTAAGTPVASGPGGATATGVRPGAGAPGATAGAGASAGGTGTAAGGGSAGGAATGVAGASPTGAVGASPAAASTGTGAPGATATAAGAAGRGSPTAPGPGGGASATPGSTASAAIVRVGATVAREVVPAPDGRTLYLSTGAELYRAVGDAPPALVVRVAIPPNLVALGGDRLVGGAAPACARGGGGDALRYSRDGGKSWQPARAPDEATPWLARGDEVLALGCGGVMASDDGGVSFAPVPELSPPNLEPRDLVLTPDGATAYLAAVSEGGSLGVLRAERAGGRWSTATPIMEGWGAAALALGADGTLFVATAVDVSASSDRGRTWRSVKAGLEPELLGADPSKGPLGETDQRKLREGVGVDDLAFVGGSLVAATRHGLYARAGDGAWRKVVGPSGRVTRLRAGGDAVYASTAEGVWRVAGL